MATVNLSKLRSLLPYGSLVRISETTGLSTRVLSDIFTKGWYRQYHSRVIEAALSILDETIIDPDVLKHAEELNLTTAHSVFVPIKRKKKKAYNPQPAWGDYPESDLEDLDEMDFDELVDLIEEQGFDVDPDDFGMGVFTTKVGREDALRGAIFTFLYPPPEDESDEEEDESDEE